MALIVVGGSGMRLREHIIAYLLFLCSCVNFSPLYVTSKNVSSVSLDSYVNLGVFD